MMKVLFTIILITISSMFYGNELDEKMKAADRYLAATPMSEIIDDLAKNMASQLPEEKRIHLIKINNEVDFPYLESIVREALIKTFTVDELNAFADFYGSEIGKSAISKMGKYNSLVSRPLQEEIIRAARVVENEI